MSKDNFKTLNNENGELNYETALDNIRLHTTDIWKEDGSMRDSLTPVLCNICLKNELLQERFSTVTAADILADVSIESENNTLKQETKSKDDDDDFFNSPIFSLKQEVEGLLDFVDFNEERNINQNESSLGGDARAVGYGREERQYVTYSQPFDPLVTFAGLHQEAFPHARFQGADDFHQDNVCLAVDDVSEIVDEYLNKYSSYLKSLRSPPGSWGNRPDAVLPSRFASFDLWTAEKSEIRPDKETDPECRLLASKVSSRSVKKIWSEGSSCSHSTTEDLDLYSHHGSASEGSVSPRECEDCDGQLQMSWVGRKRAESTSQLWSGRNIESFKDFVPRLAYSHQAPNMEQEGGQLSPERTHGDSPDDKCGSKFFNIWCVADTDDGKGDGVSSRCSERSTSPSGSQHLFEKSSPEAGLQIPRLVSSKRRERPIRGYKNARRTNTKDYQVTFVDTGEPAQPTGWDNDSFASNSRPAMSDTRVWAVNDHHDSTWAAYSNARRGFSKSETHQEQKPFNLCRSPSPEKVELSARSEPFVPKSSTGHPGAETLNTIDEEFLVRDNDDDLDDSAEKGSRLSPMCKPFVPRTYQSDTLPEEELSNSRDSPTNNYTYESESIFNASDDLAGSYTPWSPATEKSQGSPFKEYKLFGPGPIAGQPAKSVFDQPNAYRQQVQDEDNVGYDKGCDWEHKSTDTVFNSFWKGWNSVEERKPYPEKTFGENISLSDFQPPVGFHRASSPILTSSDSSVLGQSSTQATFSRHEHTSLYPPSKPASEQQSNTSLMDKLEYPFRRIRPQFTAQTDFKQDNDILLQSDPRQPHVASPWAFPPPEGSHILQSHGIPQVRPSSSVSFVTNQMTCMPAPQPFDGGYRKMVILHPTAKRLEPRPAIRTVIPSTTLAPQPNMKPTPFQPLRQALPPTLHRLPLEHHSRLNPPIITRPNTAFAPPGFGQPMPPQPYRHVTLATNYSTPKLVAVPTFDAQSQPGFYTPYLNFNNHNDACAPDSEVSEAPKDFKRHHDNITEKSTLTARARPIRANPANLIRIT